MTPQEWEELCDSCYSIRYPSKWTKTPAAYLGDCGIEGFIDNGIVYQCYYPEQPYANDELYEHQRNKLTTDIAKIINEANASKLQAILGEIKISEWHFVVPEYKDRRILEHAKNKEFEILRAVKNHPTKYPYINSSFCIKIMQANSFIEEISQTIRARNNKIKLRLVSSENIDYSSCDVDKVENIRRKFRAIQPDLSVESLNKLVDMYIKKYLEGVSKINKLRIELPIAFAKLHEVLMAYKSEVEIKTSLNADSSMHKAVFDNIMADFQEELKRLGIFDQSTILNLKHEVIAGWLADCSMEFIA